VSTGSACSSGAVEPSKTLLAIGLSEPRPVVDPGELRHQQHPEKSTPSSMRSAPKRPSCAASRRL
jgi:hypothetical protein